MFMKNTGTVTIPQQETEQTLTVANHESTKP